MSKMRFILFVVIFQSANSCNNMKTFAKRLLALEKKASQVDVLQNKYAATLQAQNKMKKKVDTTEL